MGRAGVRRQRLGFAARLGTGGNASVHQPLCPADPCHRVADRPVIGHDSRRRGCSDRLREDLRGAAHRRVPRRHPGRTISMHVGYVLDPDGHVSTIHDTQATNLALYYIDTTVAKIRALHLPGLSLPRDRRAGRADRSRPGDRHGTSLHVAGCSTATSPRRTRPRRSLGPCAGRLSHDSRAIRRYTNREKGQFLWDSCSESQVVMRDLQRPEPVQTGSA